MIDELTEAALYLTESENVRLVLLRAEGKTFCAGGDLNWMKEQELKTKGGKLIEAKALANMLGSMNSLPMPLISIVEGNSFGGGLGLISVSDTVIALNDAKFGLTETRLGLIPATIGPFVMKKLGESFGRNLFFSGKIFDAFLAYKSGLIHYLCENTDQIESLVNSEIENIMKCAPGAIRKSKKLCKDLAGNRPEDFLEETINILADSWESEEGKEGIKAFFEKSKAPWVN
jgi:methylglutaconyl-CoA hydratase